MSKPKHEDVLSALLDKANASTLADLVRRLAAREPDIRRECFTYLKEHVSASPDEEAKTEAEVARALWDELDLDLEELDDYGGGDYALVDHVGGLLWDLKEHLEESEIPREERCALLDEVIPYIHSRNSGLEDALYDVAYATCRDEADWRDLAERLETLGQDWPCDHARRIYRRIGDREKFLELRQRRMEYGADYHDLATFYWDCGEKEKALAVGKEGLDHAKGRMDELRNFMAARAKKAGDRVGYLDLQFAQATDRLSLSSYKAFKKECRKSEWEEYEPQIIDALASAWEDDRLEIRMHRGEYVEALAILSKMQYPHQSAFGGTRALKVAKQLETRFPGEILSYYLSGLGNLNSSETRKVYAHKAGVAEKVRHMWVNVLKTPEEWEAFARKVKEANARRPAFQEEFSNVVPDWKKI